MADQEHTGRYPRPGPDSRFRLAPGVELAPLPDGSAVLYSKEMDQSLSLNHTAALLCSYADGQHSLQIVMQEICRVFSQDLIDESSLVQFLVELEARQFLQWG